MCLVRLETLSHHLTSVRCLERYVIQIICCILKDLWVDNRGNESRQGRKKIGGKKSGKLFPLTFLHNFFSPLTTFSNTCYLLLGHQGWYCSSVLTSGSTFFEPVYFFQIKQPLFYRALKYLHNNVWHFLSKFKLIYLRKMHGYFNFFFRIPTALAKISVLSPRTVVINYAKIPLY